MSQEPNIPQVLRKAGDRWLRLPDVNSPEFAKKARRQSLAVAQSPNEPDEQAFVDAISLWDEG